MPFCFRRKKDLPAEFDDRIILAIGLSLMDVRGISYYELKFKPPIQLRKEDINAVISNIKNCFGKFNIMTKFSRIPTKEDAELLIGTKFWRSI